MKKIDRAELLESDGGNRSKIRTVVGVLVILGALVAGKDLAFGTLTTYAETLSRNLQLGR